MSERMLPVSVADWSQVIASAEKPLDFLRRKDVSVYIKVRRDSEIVYRFYDVHFSEWHASTLSREALRNGKDLTQVYEASGELPESHPLLGVEKIDSLPREGFVEEAAFLRLDDGALVEIALSRCCYVSSFSGAGFLIPRPYEVVGQTRGGYSTRKSLPIETADLARFEFTRAIIVDKKSRDWVQARMSPMVSPSIEQFAIQIKVGESDLYVTSADFEALKQDAQKSYEVAAYPFDHDERMPGIYWMFQAACALNDKRLVREVEVLDWMQARCGGDVFRGKRGGFAAKLIPKELDRAKGRKGGPKPFKVWDLENWVDDPKRFDFEFASDGLTITLAVADWWLELLELSPNESRVELAKKLYQENFDQVETGYLVRLIAGVQLSKKEKESFEEWATEMDKKEKLKSLTS